MKSLFYGVSLVFLGRMFAKNSQILRDKIALKRDEKIKNQRSMVERVNKYLKDELDIDSNLLKIAQKIEKVALEDNYFISRKLYPNIDFYSGLILSALKIPKSMFTIIFVVGRAVGWISQWIEFKEEQQSKIARPRQRYIGEVSREI